MKRKIVVASEALANGTVTRQQLRVRYTKLHRNVYARNDVELTAADRAYAAWLWSGCTATVVGLSAAAMLGSKWVPPDAPAELARLRGSAPDGIVLHREQITDRDRFVHNGIRCTLPARTAYDLGRRLPLDTAIIRIDALLNATLATVDDVLDVAERNPGARGIRRLRAALALVDGGAESPRETELRLLLVRAGFPRPVTQIPVGVRRVDMGWPDAMVGVEYDGEQHWTNPEIHAGDIERLEYLAGRGWLIVRVSARQLRHDRPQIVERVRKALAQR